MKTFYSISFLFIFAAGIGFAQTKPYILLDHPESTTPLKDVYWLSFASETRLAVTALSTEAFVWNVETGQNVHTFHENDYVGPICISQNGKYIAASKGYNHIVAYDVEKMERLYDIFLPPVEVEEALHWFIWNILISPDGKYTLVWCYPYLFVIETATGTVLDRMEGMGGLNYANTQFFPDSKRVISRANLDMSGQPGFRIYNLETKQMERQQKGEGEKWQLLSLLPDGISYYSTRQIDSTSTELVRRDLQTGEILNEIEKHPSVEEGFFAPSSDYKYYLFGRLENELDKKKKIRLVRSSTGGEVLNLSKILGEETYDQETTVLQISPDDRWAAVGLRGDVYLFDISKLTSHVENSLEYIRYEK